jgi:hypothetical protein
MMELSLGKYKLILSSALMFVAFLAAGQDAGGLEKLIGEVTFTTSENVYLRFNSNDLLQLNDTIYTADDSGNQPCLILIQKSSVSVLAERIGDCHVNKGDQVVYYYQKPKEKKKDKPQEETPEVPANEQEETEQASEQEPEEAETNKILKGIDGRVSLANYTTTGEGDVNSRSMARLSLNAENIGGSRFSFYNYAHYRYNSINRNDRIQTDDRLNFYEFVVKYEPDSSVTLSLGRDINNRMMSVGAVDGLQGEKRWKKLFAGAVVGSRPDPFDYSLNLDLFQYGAYAGVFHDKNQFSNTTVGAMEQRNGGEVDRRYFFMQHRSSLTKKLNLFATAEMDLYSKDTLDNKSTNIRPTNLYMSLNYRVTTKLSLMASYDLRKNRILYESYAENLDVLTQNDPYRHGYRLRANYRITNKIYTGVSMSHRAQSNGANNFSNMNVFLSFSDLPYIGGRWSNTWSINRNEYFIYNSISTRYTRDFFRDKLTVSPYARYLSYNYQQTSFDPFSQIYVGLDTYYEITDNLSLGLVYEYSSRRSNNYHRFNTQLIKRF